MIQRGRLRPAPNLSGAISRSGLPLSGIGATAERDILTRFAPAASRVSGTHSMTLAPIAPGCPTTFLTPKKQHSGRSQIWEASYAEEGQG